MAKPSLTVQLMHSTAANAALEAKLVVARTMYAELRSAYRATQAPVVHAPAVAPISTTRTYTKADGSVWVATRTGNRTVSHQVA